MTEPARASRLRAAAHVAAYAGGCLLVGSMLLDWPWIGRRGQLQGLTMLSRVRRVSTALGVPHAWLLSVAWFAMPVCGAVVMMATAHHSRRTRRVAVGTAAFALVETLLMMRAYFGVRLDPWAGNGLAVAMAGAALATAGSAWTWATSRRP